MHSATSDSGSFRNIIVFGAGGKNIGHHTVLAPSAAPEYTVTVLVRNTSKSTFPSNVRVVRVGDDLPHEELVDAFRGQDVLISAVGFEAKKLEYKLVPAALEAGVKRFFPSEFDFDNSDPRVYQLTPVFGQKKEMQEWLKTKESEGLSWTALATGMWLEWALAPGMTFAGIDVASREATFYTDGDTWTPSWSTLPWAAEAVLQALKHPKETENRMVFVRAFEASQQQIVAELERQQGVTYSTHNIDGGALVRESKAKWDAEGDVGAAFALVQASCLLPDYGADFVLAKKNLGTFMELPTITLEEVVKEVLKDHS